jgi:hypothetical protein
MSVKDRLQLLRKLDQKIFKEAGKLIEKDTDVFLTDIFVLGALNRILSVSSGFRKLILDRNFTCSASLLRLQIDTASRLNALRMVADREALVSAVLAGDRFDKQKDTKGNLLSDGYLIAELAKYYPWVSAVYKETSGFIHLSERHFYSSIATSDSKERSVKVSVGVNEPKYSDEFYFEILDAFCEATRVAGSMVAGYVTSRIQDKLAEKSVP